jgi:hypothetical protein
MHLKVKQDLMVDQFTFEVSPFPGIKFVALNPTFVWSETRLSTK